MKKDKLSLLTPLRLVLWVKGNISKRRAGCYMRATKRYQRAIEHKISH